TLAGRGPGAEPGGLAIVRGRFDLKKFAAKGEEAAKEHGDVLKIHKEDGFTVYELTLPEVPNQQPIFVGLASKNALVASPAKSEVLDALKVEAGQKKGGLKSKELADLIQKADAKQTMWLVALGGVLTRGLPQAGDAKKALEKVEHLTGGMSLTD